MSETCTLCITSLIVLVTIVLYAAKKYVFAKKPTLNGRHVFITGGSTGIGYSAAEYAVTLGGTVTIAARDVVKLERAAEKIISKCPGSQGRVHTLTLDVTGGYETVEKAIRDAEEKAGPVHMLVNCAGMAICGKLEDMSEKDCRHLMELNFMGSLWPTKVVLPSMKARGEGIVVFVSSQAALLGIFGLTVYGATKWAIRGLAEAAMMEAIGTGVTVSLCFPPDTDTPGLQAEDVSKPIETKLISSTGGLFSPDAVGKQLVIDALEGKPYSTVGFDGVMLTVLGGMTSTGFFNTIFKCFLLGPIRFVLHIHQYYFSYIIHKCRAEKNINKKAQ